jgi:TatD DNase family protein
MMIDTHCHIHDVKAFPDGDAEVVAAKAVGVEKIIVVGVNPADWPVATAFTEKHDGVHAICGWHPNYTADYDPTDLPILIKNLRHPKVVALGEIGLDYHWDHSPHTQQHKALRDQLKLAREVRLPVVFHAREAYGDLLDVLEKQEPNKYLFHCWAGNIDEARRGLQMGAYFGVDGPITYKKADELRAVIKFIPPHKLMLETDSPYMAPHPHRGKQNRPNYIPLIRDAVAELHGMTHEELDLQIAQNVKDFFGI